MPNLNILYQLQPVSVRVKKMKMNYMQTYFSSVIFLHGRSINPNSCPQFDSLQATTKQLALPGCFVAQPWLIYKQRHPAV